MLESYESGEWRSISKLQQEINRYREYAESWLEKNMQILVTLNAADFERLREKAKEAGVPYDTLIAKLVHQFIVGKIQLEV